MSYEKSQECGFVNRDKICAIGGDDKEEDDDLLINFVTEVLDYSATDEGKNLQRSIRIELKLAGSTRGRNIISNVTGEDNTVSFMRLFILKFWS